MATNVRGTLLSMQKVIPIMIERGGGSIVVTSSVASILGVAGGAAYAASKAAILALVRAAKRLGTNEEMAKIALFLASDDASFMHGAGLVADGGLTIA